MRRLLLFFPLFFAGCLLPCSDETCFWERVDDCQPMDVSGQGDGFQVRLQTLGFQEDKCVVRMTYSNLPEYANHLEGLSMDCLKIRGQAISISNDCSGPLADAIMSG
ncbi:MAG: hypothetical protein JW834_00195 [Candidatus Diapherotrites archaeon]|nr:hypothetical protein [Candidatus Diapherotrites archaeon]